MSPEFILRPSLSGPGGAHRRRRDRRVSPEFILRPSLSDGASALVHCACSLVSPEFILRPSLSGHHRRRRHARAAGVAGVYTPAFVERKQSKTGREPLPCVAGVYTPAFVERRGPRQVAGMKETVSPEFILRPSLSDPAATAADQPAARVSPEFILRPSLSVIALLVAAVIAALRCRRSLYSGLR